MAIFANFDPCQDFFKIKLISLISFLNHTTYSEMILH